MCDRCVWTIASSLLSSDLTMYARCVGCTLVVFHSARMCNNVGEADAVKEAGMTLYTSLVARHPFLSFVSLCVSVSVSVSLSVSPCLPSHIHWLSSTVS